MDTSEQTVPMMNDRRQVIIEQLPISGQRVVMNPVKARHLDNIDTAISEAQRTGQPLSALRVMYVMVSQLLETPMSLDQFLDLDSEDVEVLGSALRLFPAFSQLGKG
jgi:hypothetical protein